MLGWGNQSIWGIFDQYGNPVLEADSVGSVEYQETWRISDYPQEQGGFESYNKVKVPFVAKITFLVSGDLENRADFLKSIQQATASLNLFTVVTPEISYPSANLTFYTYKRTSRNGVQLLSIEVWCEEVRIVQTGQLSNTQSSNGADPVNNGSSIPQNTGANGSPNLVTGTALTSTTSVTQTQAPPYIAPNSGLTVPSGSSSETFIQSSTIGPAYYNSSNLPNVPNTYDQLTTGQTTTIIDVAEANDSTAASAYPLSPSNSSIIVQGLMAY